MKEILVGSSGFGSQLLPALAAARDDYCNSVKWHFG